MAGTIRQENIPQGAKHRQSLADTLFWLAILRSAVYRYTPFGEQVFAKGKNAEEGFMYNAEAYDAVSRSYYLRARFYEPVAMRFNQPDTVRGDVREPQSLNGMRMRKTTRLCVKTQARKSLLWLVFG